MAGPAIVGRRLLKNERIGDVLAVCAAGEMLVDKHPACPNRNTAQPLAARTVTGALTGAAIMVSGAGWSPRGPLRSRSASLPLGSNDVVAAAAVGALIGGVTAFVSTHVTYRMRRRVSESTGAPNVAIGAVEDAMVYTTGVLLASELD